MPGNTNETPLSGTWDQLASTYASSRQVSADRLIEWPAQLRMCGEWKGKRVLDLGCGTGEKARFFAEHGAAEVLGVDPSDGFRKFWDQCEGLPNLGFAKGSFEDFTDLAEVKSRPFDLVVCFQALMYAADLRAAVRAMAEVLASGGDLVISVPHPFRFAVLKNEREGWLLGHAYQQTGRYRYPSPWDESVHLEHAMPRVSDYANAIAAAGLRMESMDEPAPTEDFRALAPRKAAWMDRYVGILIFKAHRDA